MSLEQKSYASEQVVDRLKYVLKSQFEMPEPFPLFADDAVISGSVVLDSIYSFNGSSWYVPDVDIFCKRSAVKRIREYLVKHKFKFVKMFRKEYHHDAIVETWAIPSSSRERDQSVLKKESDVSVNILKLPPLPENTILGRLNYPNPKSIQLIIVNDDYKSLVNGQFDFQILENEFDGKSILMHHPDQVRCMMSIVKADGLDPSQTYRLRTRQEKYKNRGIRFVV
jgi:hypothetical protein